jgi:hypothetical protein
MALTPIENPDFSLRARPVGYDVSYKIEGDTLLVGLVRKVDKVRLSDIAQMRFTYEPGNISAKGFKTKLTLKDGRTITFGNISWRSFVEIDRQEEAYRRFVTGLAGAVAKANPQCRFVSGKPLALWIPFAVLGISASFGMAFFAWSGWSRGNSGAAFLALLLFGFAIWQIEPMVRLNRPRELSTGEVPPRMLP